MCTMRPSFYTLALTSSFTVLVGLMACGSDQPGSHFPNYSGPDTTGGSGGTVDAGTNEDASTHGGSAGINLLNDGGCGSAVYPAILDPVRLYFVVDRSGSMADSIQGVQKYYALRTSIVNLVQAIGWRLEVGVAIYPFQPDNDSCNAGTEVLKLTPGDPKSYADTNTPGPTTIAVAHALNVFPKGGTPTAATLNAISDTVTKFGKNTYVLLATDGGPNCNNETSCTAAQCIPSIEEQDECNKNVNCCDPSVNIYYSPGNCLDTDETLSAISKLAYKGVKTIVMGIPGTEMYSGLLDSMAVAGGAPRNDDPRYYAVSDISELSDILAAIGNQVTITCDFTFEKEPPDERMVNVFLDSNLVLQDDQNGWSWTGATSLRLNGDSCDKLLKGEVGQVNVMFGCPTEVVE